MKIHKVGYRVIFKFFVLLLIANIIIGLVLSGYALWQYIIYGASLIFLIIVGLFFREPKRPFDVEDDGTIICPADGKIVVIEEVEENEFFKDVRRQVSIFMSITNVHINWYPINGLVKYVKYHAGKYLVAFHPKSSEENEQNTVVVGNERGDILFRQIAGYVARKIVSYAEPGNAVERGDQVGIIKFGSRVDLFLPMDASIEIELNQKVTAGKTVIGRLAPAS
ncbi:MAG: phosphatidylserine decarboxylase family protein [Bacteroidales bacterium]|nr:phosphatidylserine decarboxylase family protein [Bacteroidales bacterium]MCF8332627.1 phosphatidylserine decarboxylase family protein [Bacteroidales bacterium]